MSVPKPCGCSQDAAVLLTPARAHGREQGELHRAVPLPNSPVLSWNQPSHPPQSLFSTLPRRTWEVSPKIICLVSVSASGDSRQLQAWEGCQSHAHSVLQGAKCKSCYV